MRHQYLLHAEPERLLIIHVGTNTVVGSARQRAGKYAVQTDQGGKVGIVNSISDVIPTLLDYCEKHPAQWQGDSATGFSKFTHLGDARVERHKFGPWIAYRNDGFALLHNGKPAIFGTAADAQRAVDAHLLDN